MSGGDGSSLSERKLVEAVVLLVPCQNLLLHHHHRRLFLLWLYFTHTVLLASLAVSIHYGSIFLNSHQKGKKREYYIKERKKKKRGRENEMGLSFVCVVLYDFFISFNHFQLCSSCIYI